MVSPLWKAASDGDVQKVLEFLNEPSAVDIELKDHTGITPLIEAVRNGHVEVVRVLLDKGADPLNASSQGRPESYTSDPAIVELLQNAEKKTSPDAFATQPVFNGAAGPEEGEKVFYPQPPQDGYTYYPTINPSLSTVNEPGAYYSAAQPGPPDGVSSNGMGNLPPPDVARLIPCRYFPACRYGAQCIFAHPQTNYYQGPMPPVQYPPYDPMAHQYVPQYYPPPPFQQPPSAHNMSPMSPPPGPPVMHARSPSEVVSPSLGHFNPNGPPPPPGPGPYGPLSPPVYPHPGHVPMGMPPMPPLPPQHPHPPVPQSHPNLYNPPPSSVPPFPMQPDVAAAPYPVPAPPQNVSYQDPNAVRSPENPQAESYNQQPTHRDGPNNHRRGNGRRISLNSRKPPCLFFPAGRCKNGDDCRFPHVLPENGASPNTSSFPSSRGGPPRPRPHPNGVNGHGNVEAKLGNMTIRDETPRQKNGVEGSNRSQSSDTGAHSKFHQSAKHANGASNSHVQNKKAVALKNQQRVPSADDFPVLAGTVTPPHRISNGLNGPTAAQVLQAPPPARKDGSKESSTRGTTPDPTRGNASKDVAPDANGIREDTAPAQEAGNVNMVSKPAVMSFAAAAAATPGASEISKEVSVSA